MFLSDKTHDGLGDVRTVLEEMGKHHEHINRMLLEDDVLATALNPLTNHFRPGQDDDEDNHITGSLPRHVFHHS